MLAGTGRNIMSRSEYNRARDILGISGLSLPDWGTLNALRTRLKERFGFRVAETRSPLGTPCFSLNVKEIISQVCLVFRFETRSVQLCQFIRFGLTVLFGLGNLQPPRS